MIARLQALRCRGTANLCDAVGKFAEGQRTLALGEGNLAGCASCAGEHARDDGL